MDKIYVVRECERELIRELSVDRKYRRECVQLTFGMSVNGSMGERNSGAYYSSFRVSFVASFLLDVLSEFGINSSDVFRCFC